MSFKMTAITSPSSVHSSTDVNGQLFPLSTGPTVEATLVCQSNLNVLKYTRPCLFQLLDI